MTRSTRVVHPVEPSSTVMLITPTGRQLRSLLIPIPLFALAACASPTHAPLDLASSEVAWLDRGPATLEQALVHADLGATSIPAPDADRREDPRQDAYWDACALAWNAEVRAARNELLARFRERDSAGAPAPIAGRVVDHRFGGGDDLVEAILTFDLIGLLGLEPAAAAEALADVEVMRALARYEEAVWGARLDVERARVRLAAARARLERVLALEAEAGGEARRIEILERTGREAAADVAAARARTEALERARLALAEAFVRAEEDLKRTAGLPWDHPVAVDDAHLLTRYAHRDIPAIGGDLRRVDTHPTLRRARIEFALAEARAREVAASAWPGLQLGPHLAFLGGTTVGGVLAFSLPWPSSWRGRLAAAEARREGARQAFEDAWLDVARRDRAGLERLDLVRDRQHRATVDLDTATQAAWSGMRARYRVGATPLMEWADALGRRSAAVNLLVDDAEALGLAWIDVLDARGPAALPDELDLSGEVTP